MKTLAVWNPKGGVGKTTISLHLAGYFSSIGQRVLLVDLDPQGSAVVFADRDLITVTKGIPQERPDADIVLFDCPPVLDLPPAKSVLMPINMDALAWTPALRGRKLAEEKGHRVLQIPNRVHLQRSEEASALKAGDYLHHIKDRSIYPRLIGKKKTAFDQAKLIDRLYGIRDARAEMETLGEIVNDWLNGI